MTALADTLTRCYGLRPATITEIPTGTATDNYCVTDHHDHRWFAKTYRDGAETAEGGLTVPVRYCPRFPI